MPLVKCHRCTAHYAPGGWCTARDLANGTEPPRYVIVATIPDDCCPICRRPPLLEKPAKSH